MNIVHNVKQVLLLSPVVLTADAESRVLDTQGFERAAFSIQVGAVTVDGSNYMTAKVQESDTTADADFTDVAAADLIGSTIEAIDAAGNANTVQTAEYKGTKRYLRVVLTETGTTASVACSVLGLLGDPRHAPVDAPEYGAAAS